MYKIYRVFKIVLNTFLVTYLSFLFISGGYAHYQRQTLIHKIIDGEVRGNKSSQIYHLASCPNYNSISPSNLEVFNSTEDAEEAEYIYTNNCSEDVLNIRKTNEEFPEGW